MDAEARIVLDRYAALAGARLVPLGNRGGFSGARLWRVQTSAGDFCLRAWPADGPGPDRLRWIHQLMARAGQAGLHFVPTVLTTSDGTSHVTAAGRHWEVCSWLAGHAALQRDFKGEHLAAAGEALAHLHRAWAEIDAPVAPCPAVRRRLHAHDTWTGLIRGGWSPRFPTDALDPLFPWAWPAWEAVRRLEQRVPLRLAPWVERPVPLQPCLCDVWHDHVLFEGAAVSGIVDYGSVKMDHVAVDLARLLGSLSDGGRELLDAYDRVRPLSSEERELIAVLEETGTIIGAANWLRWLYRDGTRYDDLDGVAQRLGSLVTRLQRW